MITYIYNQNACEHERRYIITSTFVCAMLTGTLAKREPRCNSHRPLSPQTTLPTNHSPHKPPRQCQGYPGDNPEKTTITCWWVGWEKRVRAHACDCARPCPRPRPRPRRRSGPEPTPARMPMPTPTHITVPAPAPTPTPAQARSQGRALARRPTRKPGALARADVQTTENAIRRRHPLTPQSSQQRRQLSKRKICKLFIIRKS